MHAFFHTPLELYVHIPFCLRKCAYCDFVSAPASTEKQEAYAGAVLREIAAADVPEESEVTSVFFGGGTPSILEPGLLAGLLDALRERFFFSDDAEITLEANPGTVDAGRLARYRRAGFNRISIGCQSARDEELERLGRIHTFRTFRESFRLAREAGFSNISVDLMSGLPGQTAADWEESLRAVARLRPEHLSAYSLIVEPGTPFAEQELDLPDEDTEREMYERTAVVLREYGYRQYEISNYAQPGFACRHNIGYWTRTEYLGFGVAAASLFRGERWTNTDDTEEYLRDSARPDRIRRERQTLRREDCMEEFMFLGLRMTRGVEKERFRREFGESMEQVYGPVLEKYRRLGLLTEEDGHVALTRAGISVSNVVLADFLLS